MQEFEFYSPQSLQELLELLRTTGGHIVAGGTDILPRMRRGLFQVDCLIDASRVEELRFIREDNGRVTIGALVTHQDLAESVLLQQVSPSLVEAARSVGSRQTRYRGTLGGNIANASPAADTVPPLLTYDANVRLMNAAGERVVALASLLDKPGRIRLQPGEMIHSISFNKLTGYWGAANFKLGLRNGMAISVVNAAAVLVLDKNRAVIDARLALGSVAPTVVRCSTSERALLNRGVSPEVLQKAGSLAVEDISPISDIRSSAEYRKKSAGVLARRALEACFNQALERMPA